MDVSVADILAIGFTGSMYGIDQDELESMIDEVIFEQAGLVKARVGSARYVSEANLKAVNKAVKCLAASEMARRRIIALSANTVSDGAESGEANTLRRTIYYDWEVEAERWINKILSGNIADSGGFASGCTVSESGGRLSYK